jgi:D-glycero-alpha-D-manno-heptose-7-phosphate kinase
MALKAYRTGHDVLKWKIGKQDEFGATFGGFNLCKFKKKKVNVIPISLNKNFLKELEDNSMLFNIGYRGHSSKILEKQVANIKKSAKAPLEALHRQKEIALEITNSLKKNDLTEFTELLKEGWEQKKKYANGITNRTIEQICKISFLNGANALKVTGAGGGGHLYVIANPSKHKRLEKSLQKLGVKKVPFSFIDKGTQLIQLNHI